MPRVLGKTVKMDATGGDDASLMSASGDTRQRSSAFATLPPSPSLSAPPVYVAAVFPQPGSDQNRSNGESNYEMTLAGASNTAIAGEHIAAATPPAVSQEKKQTISTSESSRASLPRSKSYENTIPTDVHEILICVKEMRLPGARQPSKMIRVSRTTGERTLEVALAEARIITENVYVQRKPRTLEEDEVPVCICKRPDRDDVMGCLEDCVNRAALIECHPDFCPCRDRCDNQRIQRGHMPDAEIIDAGKKGLGMITKQHIRAGDFVAEYMGEIVTEQEYHLRRLRYHHEKHRYMMVLSGGEVIDATRMGGVARFINHSCDPNCGVEKWEVHGEERCAIFALRDIEVGEELSFDYKFQSFSTEDVKSCLCGAATCRGYIGVNNRAVKRPRKSSNATGSDRSKRLDPITKKGTTNRKTFELALDRLYHMIAGHRAFTKREISMLIDSRLLLKRNLQRHLDENMRFLCLEPYFMFTAEDDSDFEDMPPTFNVRALPDFPAKMPPQSRPMQQQRLEEILERIRTRMA